MARYAPLPASHRPAKGRDIKIEREMETMSNLFNKAQGTALELAMNYVLKDPARNLPRLVDAVEKLDVTG